MYKFDDYEYNYSNYLAEKEYRAEVEALLNQPITEANLSVITESLQSSVDRYLAKVTANIQKVWNKYNAQVGTEKQREALKQYAPAIADFQNDFSIQKYPNYNQDAFNNLKVIPFNYERMRNDLKDRKQFIKTYYPDLYTDQKFVKFDKIVMNYINTGRTNVTCDKKLAAQVYAFCTKTLYTKKDLITNDIKVINASNDVISGMANSVVASTNEALAFCESMLLEAPVDTTDRSKDQKMTFSNSNGEKQVAGDRKADFNKGAFIKSVRMYMDISTDIISAKMKVLKQMYVDYFDVLVYIYMEYTKAKKAGGGAANTTGGKEDIHVDV